MCAMMKVRKSTSTWVFLSEASASRPNISHLGSRVDWNAYMHRVSRMLERAGGAASTHSALSTSSGRRGDDARESETRPSTML